MSDHRRSPPASSRPTPAAPPRTAEGWLRRHFGDGVVARSILGDLREEHSEVALRHGRRRAAAWYWTRTAALVAGDRLHRGSRRFRSIRTTKPPCRSSPAWKRFSRTLATPFVD